MMGWYSGGMGWSWIIWLAIIPIIYYVIRQATMEGNKSRPKETASTQILLDRQRVDNARLLAELTQLNTANDLGFQNDLLDLVKRNQALDQSGSDQEKMQNSAKVTQAILDLQTKIQEKL